MSDKTLGQVAFEAYRQEVVTAFNGDPIPGWYDLDNGAPARRGWEAAAQAIRQHTQMIQALDVTTDDYRGRQRSRWQPVWTAPVGEPEPEFSTPIGRGEAPDEALVTDAHRVPVEAKPDCDHPETCDIHGHEG